jgi:hypothetical protein
MLHAALQRALWNAYYSMYCAKAGVATQLCSWIYGLPLQTGHSDDTRFIADSDILRMQREFAENDSSSYTPRPHKIVNGAKKMKNLDSMSLFRPRYGEHEVYHNFF